MFEFFQHLMGLCPDHDAHLNLLQVFAAGAISSIAVYGKAAWYALKKYIGF